MFSVILIAVYFFLISWKVLKIFVLKKIILASSGGTVYGEPEYLPIDEKHPLRPLSPYGITKSFGRRIICIFIRENME